MKTVMTLAVLMVASSLAAQAQDETGPDETGPVVGPTLAEGPDATALVPVDATAAVAEAAPLLMHPALPHYYGRGEWPGCGCGQTCGAGCGPRGGCSTCDGATWGCCPRPRTYHLHLWDDYCYESTRCPACGFKQGSLAHYWCCERQTQCCCQDAGCANGSCAGCAGAAEGAATMKPSSPNGQAEVPPAPPSDEKIEKSVPKTPEAPKATPKKDMAPPSPTAPALKSPMSKEPMSNKPMPKDLKEKTARKSNRVVPAPRSASLLDRLFPWATSGSR